MSNWFERTLPRKEATLRVFCFPYAGGGASVYRSWNAVFPANIELVTCQLPGRENRFRERAATEIKPLVATLGNAIRPLLDRPYVFFGHSLGGLISFELARHMQGDAVASQLKGLLLSGCRPPHLRAEREFISRLPDAEFIEALRDLDGTPEDFFRSPELMDVYLPIIRADFAVAESYVHHETQPLTCPMELYAGMDDDISLDDMITWRRYTSGPCRMTVYAGNHFFIHSHKAALQSNLTEALRTLRSL